MEDMKQRIYRGYHKNGKLKEETHYLGDKEATEDNIRRFKFNRIDGPARIWYDEDGKKEDEAWYVDNKWHRTDGPARIWYSKNGKVKYGEWRVNDKILNEKEIQKLKIMIELNKEVLK